MLTDEEEWLTSPEPGRMLLLLQGRPSPRQLRHCSRPGVGRNRRRMLKGRALARKWRLFAVACCRRVWDALTDSRSQRAVEVAERFADGLGTTEELRQAFFAAWDASLAIPEPQDPGTRAAADAARFCAWHLGEITDNEASKVAWWAAFSTTVLPGRTMGAERSTQCDLLRDLFGNPFRPLGVDPAWLAWGGGIVPLIGRTIYEECRFDQMPILADALEEAGCFDRDILDHCRGPREHVRGCWVVDLVLAKE